MSTLAYKSHSLIEGLSLDECTMHRASGSNSARWWQLWWRVSRTSDGQPQIFCVPVNPNGPYLPLGPGGKTWGLTKTASGIWQISPSINVLASGDATDAANHPRVPSLWHETPAIINVPDAEPWITSPP